MPFPNTNSKIKFLGFWILTQNVQLYNWIFIIKIIRTNVFPDGISVLWNLKDSPHGIRWWFTVTNYTLPFKIGFNKSEVIPIMCLHLSTNFSVIHSKIRSTSFIYFYIFLPKVLDCKEYLRVPTIHNVNFTKKAFLIN